MVALENPRGRVAGAQPDHAIKAQFPEPLAVETDLCFLRIEDFEYLRFVGFRIAIDLLAGEWRAGNIAAGRIPDQSGHVADQENHRVTQIPKILHFSK